MKTRLLLLTWLIATTCVVAQSNLPVVSVLPFSGHGNTEQVKSILTAGLTNSKRIRLVDRQALDAVIQEQKIVVQDGFQDNTVIIKSGQLTGAQYVLEGTITAINYGNQRIGDKYYNNCRVEVAIKLTDIESGTSESEVLRGYAESDTQQGSVLEADAISSIRSRAETYARRKFPASMEILEILEKSDRKGIVSFRVEGEGLTANRPSTGTFDLFGKTIISIINLREVTRADGSVKKVQEEIATARIKEVESGGTAICIVKDGGKRLQELMDQKAQLVLKTIN